MAKGLSPPAIQPGPGSALMSRTRYEWTLIDFAIWACGAVTVPIYETSSASRSRGSSPTPAPSPASSRHDEHRAIVTPVRDDRFGLDTSGRSTSAHDRQGTCRRAGRQRHPGLPKRPSTGPGKHAGSQRPGHHHLHQRHHRAAPKAACSPTATSRFNTSQRVTRFCATWCDEGESTLLFLPLAHAFARLIQVRRLPGPGDHRAHLRHQGPGRATCSRSSRRSCSPLPGYSRRSTTPPASDRTPRARARSSTAPSGSPSPTARPWTPTRGPGPLLRAQHALFDRLVYSRLRAAVGGRCKGAISGSAPLGGKFGHFFRGVGMTIYEGYGLTETSPAIAVNLNAHQRIGTVGRPLPGVTVRIADDGEILVKSDIVFRATGTTRRPPPRPSTRTAGSTPATWAISTTTAT